ncbi:site-specific integrase [Salinibacterium sp. SWN1162]|uniref:tyrosine-type recombinase/integrase n=1 Tax=Salinibacterium sp. SWN1162 TaxID=2792053 RepID=UPI0027DD9A95|nr:site-specific integrase [Salinibacterium sp. SWN1162]
MTKKAAELFLASTELAKARGEFIDAAAARMTIGELGALWLKSQTHLKPSTLRVVEMAWRVHVAPEWAVRGIGGVLHSEVQAWVSALTREMSATSVLRAYGILAAILDVAVKDRRLALNPARSVTLPRKVKKAHVYLSHEEVWRLAGASSGHDTLVLMLAYTGLRWGEVTGLKVKHLNALRRRVNVTENAVAYGQVIHIGTPKSHEARSVPYPQFLAEPIAQLCYGKGPDDLLFGDGNTHMRRPNTSKNQTSWFIRALASAELESMTVHDLRHSAASLAISAGANVKAVQRMLGHASAAMTLDTYADLFDDDLDAVSVALDQAASKSNVGKMWANGERAHGQKSNVPVNVGSLNLNSCAEGGT